MNVDEYFLRPQDKIPPKENRNPVKTSRAEATASMRDSDPAPQEEDQQQLQANNEVVLDTAFHQTIQELTANITRVIDEKLRLLSQTI